MGNVLVSPPIGHVLLPKGGTVQACSQCVVWLADGIGLVISVWCGRQGRRHHV